MEKFVEQVYDSWSTDATDADRVSMLPTLSPTELDQLKQLITPTYDGNVISKAARTRLVDKCLVARWNGLNFITQAGVCVLDILGLLGDKTKFKGGHK